MLTVVIPCYNEAEAARSFPSSLYPELDALGREYEIIAVDDGSRDETARALSGQPLKVLAHAQNQGLGAALRTGLAAARGEWVVFLDADFTFHPRHIKALLAAQRETGADCVSGAPVMDGVPWSRRLPSLILNACYRRAFDRRLRSYTPMFRLYRTEALRALDLRSSGFEISAEILVKLIRAGKRIVEIPVPLGTRSSGESKLRRLRELRRHFILIARLLF